MPVNSKNKMNRVVTQKVYMTLCLDYIVKDSYKTGRTFDELKEITCSTELSLCSLLSSMISFNIIKEAVNRNNEVCYKAINIPPEILNSDNIRLFRKNCTMYLYKLKLKFK